VDGREDLARVVRAPRHELDELAEEIVLASTLEGDLDAVGRQQLTEQHSSSM
jgi:hypothetical protein